MKQLFKNMNFYISRDGRVIANLAKKLQNHDLLVCGRNRDFEKMKELLGEEKFMQLKYMLGAPTSSFLFFINTFNWEQAEDIVKLTYEFEKIKKDAAEAPHGTIILKRPIIEILQKINEIYGEKNLKKFKEYLAISVKDEPEELIEKTASLLRALRAEDKIN